MLENLRLTNVGPGSAMSMDLGRRLNLVTGDNGLGKSFLLDVAWWALTRRWPHDLNANLASGYAARPTDAKAPARISFAVKSKSKRVAYESHYARKEEAWVGKAGRPWNPGLVVYALADGAFAVWDPARNYWRKKGNVDIQDRVPAYVFGAREVWDGLVLPIDGKPTRVSNGLVADWASWIREQRDDAARMEAVLALLAPAVGDDAVRPGGDFARLSVNDARDIPTVRMGYGQDVPILFASLGVRRITALAYMLTWAWREHLVAARQLGEPPSARVVMLFDEIEAHLHPRWQRAVVPALLEVVRTLTKDAKATVQLVAATHSPLVLASVEPFFDAEQDAWFDLDLDAKAREVTLEKRTFTRRGEAGMWLTSPAFDMKTSRSVEAERALDNAAKLLAKSKIDAKAARELDAKLRAVLGETDPFWTRWRFVGERQGWLARSRRAEP